SFLHVHQSLFYFFYLLLFYSFILVSFFFFFFFFNDTATTEIYTLSLHDALPISHDSDRLSDGLVSSAMAAGARRRDVGDRRGPSDRKSTRLNSSHVSISYAVFCLKKKKKKNK